MTAEGIRSFENVKMMSLDIVKACLQHGTPRVLVDVRKLKGRLPVLDAYEIPEEVFPKIRDQKIIEKSAIIDLKEFQDSYKFFENVAVNRGYILRVFSDVAEALHWLKE